MGDTCRQTQNHRRRATIRVRRSAANLWLPRTNEQDRRPRPAQPQPTTSHLCTYVHTHVYICVYLVHLCHVLCLSLCLVPLNPPCGAQRDPPKQQGKQPEEGEGWFSSSLGQTEPRLELELELELAASNVLVLSFSAITAPVMVFMSTTTTVAEWVKTVGLVELTRLMMKEPSFYIYIFHSKHICREPARLYISRQYQQVVCDDVIYIIPGGFKQQ